MEESTGSIRCRKLFKEKVERKALPPAKNFKMKRFSLSLTEFYLVRSGCFTGCFIGDAQVMIRIVSKGVIKVFSVFEQ
jgi:hypothetical protein